MLAEKQALIGNEIAEGTGAEISIEADNSSVQSGLKIWFADLQRSSSPQVHLHPAGLHRYVAQLSFGSFSGQTINQMQEADEEKKQLAHALVQSTAIVARIAISDDQTLDDWEIKDENFSISLEKKGIKDRFGDEALISTCRDLVIPLLGAMAELYGYDTVEQTSETESEPAMEGAVLLSIVKRRERNRRNRLLCLRLQGESCVICGLDPKSVYGDAGSIIEVHHLQPLAANDAPKQYDPATDLVPLCPSCHRAVHSRRPMPWTPHEIRERIHATC
jgi:5-methylcytosine-specific restriction enzyme A